MRRVMAVFGSMFNDIRVQRTDENGTAVKVFTVPIEQAQRENYLVRLYEESKKGAAETPSIAITLPRLSYELVSVAYRPETKLQTTKYLSKHKTENDDRAFKMFNPVPYTMNIDLSLYTRTFDDALQITEQILPFFAPALAVTINEVPQLGLKNDVIFQLNGLTPAIESGGHISANREIIWTLNFSARMNIYHPINDPKIIKQTIANIDVGDNESIDQIITQTVDPRTADRDDSYTIIKTVVEPEI